MGIYADKSMILQIELILSFSSGIIDQKITFYLPGNEDIGRLLPYIPQTQTPMYNYLFILKILNHKSYP